MSESDCNCRTLMFTILAGIIGALYLLKLYLRQGKYTKATRIDGKVVIITGGNAGIGKANAIDLAKRGGKIYIACRDLQRGEKALNDIKHESGSEDVHLMQLDLADLQSVRDFSKRFHEKENKLHILINNAGVMGCPKMLTKDGFELQLGVNHLGHFLLTHLLLDLLKSSSPSRIVNVSSRAHMRSDIIRDDLMGERSYNPWTYYSQSKLANVLFSQSLAKKLAGTGVSVNSCHPGVVCTELGRYINPIFHDYVLMPVASIFFKTPEEGAQTQIRLAVDPDLEKTSGKYFVDCMEAPTSQYAESDETAEWLYEKSKELVKL